MNHFDEKSVALVIGRFQPLHLGHELLIKTAFNFGEIVVVAVGVTEDKQRNYKNPYTFEERAQMIRAAFRMHFFEGKLLIVPVVDYKADDHVWCSRVNNAMHHALAGQGIKVPQQVYLADHRKDEATANYLSLFDPKLFKPFRPNSPVITTPSGDELSATSVRRIIYEAEDTSKLAGALYCGEYMSDKAVDVALHPDSLAEVRKFRTQHTAEKANAIQPASSLPFSLIAADCLVEVEHYILAIRRKDNGKIALPGGLVERNEDTQTAALRELQEETGLTTHGAILNTAIFDEPDRDPRGNRVLSVGYHIKHGFTPCEVKAGDDAKEAFWLHKSSINTAEWFADHREIVRHFLNI